MRRARNGDRELQSLKIGEMTIVAVNEMSGPTFPATKMFPHVMPEFIAKHTNSLIPHFIEAQRGLINMSYHSYLITTPRHKIIVDTGIGNGKIRGQEVPFLHEQRSNFIENLSTAGFSVADIDLVVCTHLHVDHVGWNTRLVDGGWQPTFPNARYIFGRKEFEFWSGQFNRGDNPGRGSFEDSVMPVVKTGQVELAESNHIITNGIYFEAAYGHSPGHMVVHVIGNRDHAIMTGDVVVHPLQIFDPNLATRFCADPEQAAVTRRSVLDRIANTSTLFLPAHFVAPTACHVIRHKDAFSIGD